MPIVSSTKFVLSRQTLRLRMKEYIYILLLSFFVGTSISFQGVSGDIVVRTPKESHGNEKEAAVSVDPTIYEMEIHTNISNRFAKTLITSKVKNPNKQSQETTFTVILPEKAFISGFVLKINEKEYKAYVKEKEEAKKIYEVARARGQTAGHVAVSARDSNTFTISVNVEPEGKAAFLLTYEELLERKNNQYELILNIQPGQVVEKLDVKVLINESRPLRFVRTPSVRTGNEIDKSEGSSNELSTVDIIEKNSAVVEFHPDKEQQVAFARKFGKEESEGLSGQFVVQYDVERDPNGGEVLLQDGYFVHFFAPDDLKPLPKHVVFVLDTSGSMGGRKMTQLQEAMRNILGQVQPGDQVSLVEFNSAVYVWDITSESRKEVVFRNYANPFQDLEELSLPRPASVNENNETITKAKRVVGKYNAGGSTNIIGGLDAALSVIKTFIEEKNDDDQHLQPIIMFLTDGEPLGGNAENAQDKIHKIITKLNAENNHVPIFALSLGEGADKGFLRKLSLKNSGFSRHIYEAADTSFQLENFYKEISVPLLSDVKFEYADDVNVTKYRQSVYFRGGEIAICGVYDTDLENPLGDTKIVGIGNTGHLSLVPSIEKPVSSLERLWAYLTVKDKLEARETAESDLDKHKIGQEALNLALKYSFVTEVTSLVVVKPNDTYATDPLRPLRRPIETRSGSRIHSYAALSAPTTQYYASPRMGSSLLHLRTDFKMKPAAMDLSSDFDGIRPEAGISFSRPIAYLPRYTTTKATTTTTTTTTPTTTVQPTTSVPSYSILKSGLPWLGPLLAENGTININGDYFKLGDDNAIDNSPVQECPKTPTNSTGICTHLKDCPKVFPQLTDLHIYQQYFCAISDSSLRYAGVCCETLRCGT